MTLNHIAHEDLEFEECMDEIVISIPGGHAYIDKDVFFSDMYAAIEDEYEINGYDNAILYIKSYDAVYSGAFACNTFVQNSIIDLFNGDKCIFTAVDDDDKADIIEDFFE